MFFGFFFNLETPSCVILVLYYFIQIEFSQQLQIFNRSDLTHIYLIQLQEISFTKQIAAFFFSLKWETSMSYWQSYIINVQRNVLLWTPKHGHASIGRPHKTYLHQLCEDTGCSAEELPKVMEDREGRRNRRESHPCTHGWWMMMSLHDVFAIIGHVHRKVIELRCQLD